MRTGRRPTRSCITKDTLLLLQRSRRRRQVRNCKTLSPASTCSAEANANNHSKTSIYPALLVPPVEHHHTRFGLAGSIAILFTPVPENGKGYSVNELVRGSNRASLSP